MSPAFRVFLHVVLAVFLLALLFGCACDGGFRNMSDQWCQTHERDMQIPPGYPDTQWFQCTPGVRYCTPIPTADPAQSWDQDHLKREDLGCPGAVFVAPDGNLEQC